MLRARGIAESYERVGRWLSTVRARELSGKYDTNISLATFVQAGRQAGRQAGSVVACRAARSRLLTTNQPSRIAALQQQVGAACQPGA